MTVSVEPRPLSSAFQSPTFGEDSSFHVDQPVGSMSISPCGRDVVLASREGLHIIDLDSPYSPPRNLLHDTPWEVADVQWSPFAARDYWVVSTSNQKALVWNLAMKNWENAIELVLHGHTRAITDINFSAHHPDVLATCAVDSFVHCWDLRAPARPAISFSDWFAGATQVKWNRQDSHVIASSHDKYLRIWDDRMGAYPIRSIEAHSTKIYGIDWNRLRRDALVTCSLDKTIKFWDTSDEGDIPEKMIRTPFPVWRARNTPFGWGVLAMPQRGNNDLHLYSRRAGDGPVSNKELPLVHSFPGHKGQVKEFLWRPRGDVVDGYDHREFQLVSWGTDRELRLHRVNPDILKAVGYEKGKSAVSTLNITRKGAVYKTFRDENREPDSTMGISSPGLHIPDIAQPMGSKGMNMISMPHSRGFIHGAQIETRAVMQLKARMRADTNPIAWMRGVKISGWDVETLGDEITHVGDKFTKVAFESVDVSKRRATISLHGPWGEGGTSLFLKVDIKFPIEYPRAAVPSFSIQKTAAVTDGFSTRILSDVRKVAETYLSRKRGCLEGVVRYLLGESSLEESIAWAQNEAPDTIKSPVDGVLTGDESSDEDEVGMSRSQDLGMSSELLRPVNANVMVPVAKLCGALWAPDGRLLCFFPPKKDKTAAVIDSLGFHEMGRFSKGDKVFEGFGRLQTASPGPRAPGTTTTNTDDGGSDYSDDSDAESSSSSGSSDILSGLQSRFPAPPTWRSAGSLGLHRPRSTDNSQRSTAGALTVKSAEAPHTTISIHDLSPLLPAKRDLATRYRVSGNLADVCAHNAAVALDAGQRSLAHVWALVRLILHNKVGKQAVSRRREPQYHSSSRIQRKDSALDLSFDIKQHRQYEGSIDTDIMKWGGHPFGSRWLVRALFEDFERNGDIQMLAMLSCVFHEADAAGGTGIGEQRNERPGPKRMVQQPSATDYYTSSYSTTQSRSQVVTPVNATPKEAHATPRTLSSDRSSSEQLRADSPQVISTGTTPPLPSRHAAPIPANRKSQSHNVSIAVSPDQTMHSRSGSGFGSVLASSLSRSFTFGPSSASPPAAMLSKKNKNLAGSPDTTVAASAIKSAVTTVERQANSMEATSRGQSECESEQPSQVARTGVKVRVSFKHQHSFDGGENAKIPFLNPDKVEMYRLYRAAYANLLFLWGLPLEQGEILKVGFAPPRVEETQAVRWNRRGSRTSFLLPPSDRSLRQQTAVNTDVNTVGIQRHCSNCGHHLQQSLFSSLTAPPPAQMRPVTANTLPNMCTYCKARRPQPIKVSCTICEEAVDGMLVPCLGCGHVTCFACCRKWFGQGIGESPSSIDTSEDGIHRQCPTGCGCICSEHMVADVPMPSTPAASDEGAVETDVQHVQPHSRSHSRSESQAAHPSDDLDLVQELLRSSVRRATTNATLIDASSATGQNEDDLADWHASPFASLARGLGGGLSRGLGQKAARNKSRNASPGSASHRKTRLRHVETG